jgi:lipoprotein-anchoring transpeptidase ErfK/SrfK
MKRFLQVLTSFTSLVAMLWGAAPVRASYQADTAVTTYDGDKPLCLPNAYLSDPGDCLPLGPSQEITSMAQKGVRFPAKPLPAYHPDPSLSNSPVSIARINLPKEESAPVFATFEDATQGSNPTRYIDPGNLRYMSFIGVDYYNDKPYIHLKSGEWMRASPVAYSHFQGLVFTRTPDNSFGWIVDTAEVRSAPGYASPLVNKQYVREDVVQIYDIQNADKTDWYMVGLNEWIERRYIRQVRINTTPPEGVTNNRWIEVNLYDQTVSVYDNGQLVFATMVATGGEPFFTRPGLHQVYEKKEVETMSGSFEADRSDYYYLEDVPWTMYFDDKRALHGAYWRAWFGYPGTHGCVNFSIGDAKWLYDWANVGDYVYVWDPSGETPTDPSFYGAGGA